MKRLFSLLIIIFATYALSGCTSGQKQAAGVVGGAAIGGLAGSAITGGSAVGTIIGAGLGGFGGYEITK